jgi:mono/diheme cytochrome c family protein
MRAETWPDRLRLASSLCATLFLAWGTAGNAVAQGPAAPTQNATAGAAVFGEKGCVACHSVAGEGDTLGPDLKSASLGRSFDDLAAALWNHLPAMTDRMDELGIDSPRLSPQEAGDLIAFLYTLDYFEPPGDPGRGEALFQELSCIRCHRVGGVGGVVGPDLDYIGARGVPIELATAMWNHAPAMSAAAEVRGIERPTFSGSQLVDLIAYLKSASRGRADEDLYVLPGHADDGRRVMDDKGCTDCHGVPGSGGGGATDLAGRSRRFSLTDFVAAMWNKGPAMSAAADRMGLELPELASEELSDVVAYLYSVDYFEGPGSARRGRDLLRTAGCLGCHSLAGSGAGVASDLANVSGVDRPASVVAALWNHTRVGRTFAEVTENAWPEMTGEQMEDLIAFFQAGSP